MLPYRRYCPGILDTVNFLFAFYTMINKEVTALFDIWYLQGAKYPMAIGGFPSNKCSSVMPNSHKLKASQMMVQHECLLQQPNQLPPLHFGCPGWAF